MNLDQEKWHFLNAELLASSISGAFQRAGVYTDKKFDHRHKQLHKKLRSLLVEYAKAYDSDISDETHNKNIQDLADNLSQEFGDILRGRRFRIGIAQKALNLYLKYLWCVGRIRSPPHCPFDFQIISRLDLEETERRWTEIDSIDVYNTWVESAKRKAGQDRYPSLAEWELHIWQSGMDNPAPVTRGTASTSGASVSSFEP